MKHGTWVQASNGEVPPEAIKCESDEAGHKVFVGRALHNSGMYPGKVIPSHKVCYIPFDRREIGKPQYEVLVGNTLFEWEPCDVNEPLVTKAVPGGVTNRGETLFIGRANHKGVLTPGIIVPSARCCYVPYGGKEHNYVKFDVLVWKS